MKLTDTQKLWLRGQADLILECLPEDTPIEGNVLASGQPEEDVAAEQEIRRQLQNGNEWAWCCIKVTSRWKDWSGVDYLGCCSYKSEQEFRNDGYYVDMVARSFDELTASIESSAEAFAELLVAK